MRSLSARFGTWKSLLGAAVLGLAATTVHAQARPPKPCRTPPATAARGHRFHRAVLHALSWPRLDSQLSDGVRHGHGSMTGTGEAPSDAGSFRSVTSGAGFSSNTAVGYIDSAIPQTQLRIRFDAAFDDNEPDRAAFFYAKCGCFPGAPGPGPNPDARINYQELSAYAEYALSDRFSTFFEVPLRFLQQDSIPSAAHPGNNGSTGGFSDIDFGFKYAFLMDPCQVATAQFRTYAPTGDPHEGLGNNLWVLEPAFLYYRKLSENWALEAELRDWIPVATTDQFAGNVIRYGVGLSYQWYKGPRCRVTPVAEIVGWTCLSGKELDLAAPLLQKSAAGDTIVNAKIGMRFGLGDGVSPGILNQSDLYVGYGRALTGDVWYENIFRVEFRLRF